MIIVDIDNKQVGIIPGDNITFEKLQKVIQTIFGSTEGVNIFTSTLTYPSYPTGTFFTPDNKIFNCYSNELSTVDDNKTS